MTAATVQKLDSTNAFVVTDLPEAPTADGIVRCAKKVLVGSTTSLARVRTYAWAILGQQVSGASAGINATGDDRAEAIGAFCGELAPRVADGSLSLGPGKGVSAGELAGLGAVEEPDPAPLVAGILAAAGAAGGIEGRTVAVEHDGGAGDTLLDALGAAGAEVVASGPEALGADAEVLLFGSKAGVLDHGRAADLSARLLVPTAALAFTPRALAVATRAGATVLPDFLTTAGPLAARCGLDPAGAVAERTAAAVAHEEGPVLGACLAAEDYLRGWVDELPFGRPIG